MITLECNYSKKIGLPGFSSHQFSITLKTEISDLSQVQNESARLYKLLQTGVDNSIKEIGYLPGQNGNGNGHHSSNGSNGQNEEWKCSAKQKELILDTVAKHNLDKNVVENLALERFGKGVRALNKLECSGLITELLETYGEAKGNGRSRFSGPRYGKAGAR